MTPSPKEKAIEIFSKYLSINLSQVNDLVDGIRIRLAKESALIALNEIFQILPDIQESWDYWEEVKKELELL